MRSSEKKEPVFIVPIDQIKINLKRRDDIPVILGGLQHLYVNTETREQLLMLMEEHVPEDCDPDTRQPGMDWWRLLVLATLKMGLDCDFARLEELANEHNTLRLMLQHASHDRHRYIEYTLQNNIALIPVAVLNQIGELVVQEGLACANRRSWRRLRRPN